MPPIDYTKKATESLDQYNARISGARGYTVQANPTGVSTTTNLKTGVVSSADLGSAPAITPKVPEQTPMPTVPDVPPPAEAAPKAPQASPTPFADELSKLLGEAQAGNTAMVGKATDTAALNESQGVNAKTDVINSLSSQLTGLINESKAIPLQMQQSVQEGGANVTKGGLAPIQTAALRNNAIRSLSVSSQIDAARGDLASAMGKVDRAIAAKYGPIEEAQKARLANLELLSKDPRLSRENEKRIADAKAVEEAKAEKLKTEKEIEKSKNDAILKAYSAFSTNPKFDNITQAAINAAKTDLEVAQILAYKGLSTIKPEKLDTQITRLENGNTVLIDTQTGKVIKNYGGAKPETVASEILSPTEAQTLGVPYGTTKSEASAKGITPTKPATAVQETTALYANRLQQSSAIMDKLDNYVAKSNSLAYKTMSKLPDIANALKSADFQSVEQAQRNFVNAVLRRESGAVISPSEFDNAKLQYFPLPGDTPETVAQKKANRDMVIQGFIQGAGSAYTPPIVPTTGKTSSGLTYTITP